MRLVMRWVTVVVGIVSIVPVSEARADGWLGGTFCFPGAFQACASVAVTSLTYVPPTTQTGSGFTTIIIRVVNLEGQPGFPIGEYGIRYVAVTNLDGCIRDSDGCRIGNGFMRGFAGATVVRPTGEVICTDSACGVLRWDGVPYENGVFLTPSTTSGVREAVIGCSLPLTNANQFDWSTCAPGSWVEIEIPVFGEVMLSAESRITVGGARRQSVTGITATMECTIGETCVTVTPEPGTIVLLGSGVAALAAARRRQRKRQR